jgi:tricorn protease
MTYSPANGSVSPLNITCTFKVDQREEEQALFDEVWWAMKNLYYNPAMNGKDWQALHDEYKPMVANVTSRTDFYSLMGEMLERLDSSHLGATAPPPTPRTGVEAASVGWLGVEWDWKALDSSGVYRVGRVYENSPAARPESELQVGDEVLAINGTPVGKDPISQMLDGTIGKKTVVKIRRGGATMDVAMSPVSSATIRGLGYTEWVRWNKAQVDRLSGGRLGYIHVQGMDEPSLDTFLREIQTDLNGKDGLIVDVRFNGGGYTSHIILNIMRKEPWLIRTNRDEPGRQYSENNYRGNALEMPAACLTNQYSFSNAEIFSEGFRQMKIGPVVGERTAGGVIGTGAYGLWDGGQIRMPGSGAYGVSGENLEQNGRKPDVEVLFDPQAWVNGRDMQLERAVTELMKTLPRR